MDDFLYIYEPAVLSVRAGKLYHILPAKNQSAIYLYLTINPLEGIVCACFRLGLLHVKSLWGFIGRRGVDAHSNERIGFLFYIEAAVLSAQTAKGVPYKYQPKTEVLYILSILRLGVLLHIGKDSFGT